MLGPIRLILAWFAFGIFGAFAGAAPVPVPNAKYELPTIVFQAAHGFQLLDDVKLFAKMNGATPQVLAKIDDFLKTLTGEKGFDGINMKKSIGGYAYLRPKVEQSSVIFVVPITEEKEALAFVDRLHLRASEESKAKGVFELTGGPFSAEFTGHLRFHGQYAYVSLNGGLASVSEIEKLVPINRLVDENEKGILAATLTGRRMPKELTDKTYELFDEANKEVDRMVVQVQAQMPKNFPPFMKEMLGWGRRCYDLMLADGDTLTARLLFDRKTGDADWEAVLTPKAKSGLGADLATFKSAKGRFQQLVTPESVGGGWVVLPGPIPPGARTSFANFWKEWLPMLQKETGLPGEFAPLFEAAATIVHKAIDSGEVDVGAALQGPDKDGFYTALGAIGLEDTTPLVKLVVGLAKDLPKDFVEELKLNAYKIGEVSVHTMGLKIFLPEWWEKLFGKNMKLHIAIGNKGLFLAVGPGAEVELKRALALKVAETTGFDTPINLKKAKAVIVAAEGNPRELERFPVADKLQSFMRLDVRGGPDFRVRGMSYQFVWLMGMELNR